MHLRIRTTDGHVYTTDADTEESVIAEGGTLQSAWESYQYVVENYTSAPYVQVIIGGEVMYFNPANIVYLSIVKPFKFDATAS